ncbi:MAG TPA: fatty acid desaturase [Solirubrobacteraceae bacterium]|nr:fatty acid desaturase [Solirubrobacteraceae bacterium]
MRGRCSSRLSSRAWSRTLPDQKIPTPGRQLAECYSRPRLFRSLLDIATSIVPYLALSVVLDLTLGASVVLSFSLGVLAAGFLVRTFVVFHDCAHGSLFPSKRANRWVGRLAGLLVLSPFERWRHDHAVHHGTSGDLERRGVGDIVTLTVQEYRARSWRGRLGYRLIRNPLFMFGLGPIVAMVVGPRIATRSQRPRLRHSVLATDAVVFSVFAGLCWLVGWERVLVVWAPPALLAGSVGIWLFYVQHQFEDAYWQNAADWDYTEAALRGSSYLKLPRLLDFFTGHIGFHHVHHLNARIPNYNLRRAHRENAIFHEVPTLSLLDGLRAVTLKLWDEDRAKLVSFAQASQSLGQSTLGIGRPPIAEVDR